MRLPSFSQVFCGLMLNCPEEQRTSRRRLDGGSDFGSRQGVFGGSTHSLEKRVGGVPRHWEPQRVEVPHKRDLLGRFVNRGELNEIGVQTVTASPPASSPSPMLRGELVEDEVFEYDQYSGLGQPGAFEEQFHYIDTGDVTIEPQRQELPVQQLNGHFQEEAESQADPGEPFQQVFPQQEQFHPTDHQQDQLHGQFQTQTQEQPSHHFQGQQQLVGHFEEQSFEEQQYQGRSPQEQFEGQFAAQQFFPSPTHPPAPPSRPLKKPRQMTEVVLAGIQIETTPAPAGSDGENPAFKFANKTSMNLDGSGYALTLLLVGQIVILAMAFGSGAIGNGRSLREKKSMDEEETSRSLPSVDLSDEPDALIEQIFPSLEESR